MTRQAYYKHLYRDERRHAREKLILELVRSMRQCLPRLGGRKLWVQMREELVGHGFKAPGRDRFFAILRAHGLLLERRKAQFPRTTYSGHNYAVQPNLLKNLEGTKPLQAFVSDITYLRAGAGFAYLFLVTDSFSRRIMGFHLGRTLDHQGAISALRMAVEDIVDPKGIIHHSDRGVQYCCHEFLDELHKHHMRSSMTDADHCAQNALAERMNGILKNEFYLDLYFSTFARAKRAVAQAVTLYNELRPHGTLKMATPEKYHITALAA
jgi:putative transposase